MSDGLIRGWRERVATAAAWEAGRDPEPVLDALALTVALELTGDLARVPSAERDRLRKLGQRALLHLGGAGVDEEELEARRLGAAIARDGLRALSGRAAPDADELDTRALVPPAELIRLVRGELDGFTAGSLALTIRRSRRASAELRALLLMSRPPARTLSLAAAEAAAVLDPASGRIVGTLAAAGAEAVLFDGDAEERRLAVYAEDPEPLRLVAPELTTEDTREGYWIGRVQPGVTHLEATLHAGDRAVPWTLDLSAAAEDE